MCQIREVVNQECCAPLASEPLSPGGADEMARLFKAVADPMRLRLLSLIACHDGGESCVCDLLEAFDVTAPSVSYHLKILREAGLIRKAASLTPDADDLRYAVCARDDVEHADDDTLTVTAKDIFGG